MKPYAALTMNLAAKAVFVLPPAVALFALDRLATFVFGAPEAVEFVNTRGETVTL